MRTTFFTVAALAAMVAFTSCDNESDNLPDNNTPVAVQFSAGINQALPQLRAANALWTNGDQIGIFMVDNGTTTIAESAENKQYTTTGSSSFSAVAGNQIYYPMDGSAVDFIAYYPWVNGSKLTVPYSVNTASQSNQEAIDLLWATATNSAAGYSKAYSGAANFEFSHKLTKLILNTQAGTGLNASDLTGMTVSISGLNTTANFNLADGTLTALANANTFAPLTVANGTKYEAIIVPQNASSMKVTFKLTSNEEFVWTVPSTNFLSTTEYTFAITLQRTGVTVEGTINAWRMEYGSGTAE